MNPKKAYQRLYRIRKRDEPPVVIRTDETLPDDLKADFDRLEAELKQFETFVEDDQEIKETFNRLDDELKRMELKT